MALAGLLAAAVGLAAYAIHAYRYRFVRSDADLFLFLPTGDYTKFFVNVSALRQAGMLKLLGDGQSVHESEYQQFVRRTGFDYARDVDAIAGVAEGDQLFFTLKGRFGWSKLMHYVSAQGGTCADEVCRVKTSTENRWAGFQLIQPDVLLLASSPNSNAIVNMKRSPSAPEPHPTDPIWISPSESVLKNPVDLPMPLRILAISLQSANSVAVSLGAPEDSRRASFNVKLDAGCSNESEAETIRNQLEIQTRMLKLELAREGQKPDPGGLTGLLVGGSFQAVNKHVLGRWPVSQTLIQALQ